MRSKGARVVALVLVVLLVVLTLASAFYLPVFGAVTNSYAYAAETSTQYSLDNDLSVFRQYLMFIKSHYKDDVSYETMMDGAYKGVIESLGDKYSVYYESQEEEEEFVNTVKGVYSGIGVTLQSDGLYVHVVSVNPKGPAYAAGIKADDIVISVDGVNVASKSANYVANRTRGEEGTTVKLVVERAGKQYTYTLKRMTLDLDCVAYKMLEDGIGYMSVTGFDEDGAQEFANALAALSAEGATKLIIDIRDNGGGLIKTATDMANQLIPQKTVLAQYVSQEETLEVVKTDCTGKAYQTVVLMNENSASASEIFAAALKENKAATLVGTKTYGKGIGQQVISVAGGESFKLSTMYFVTPLGNYIHGNGVTPDYEVYNTEALSGYSALNAVAYETFAPMAKTSKPKAGDSDLNVYAAQQRLSLMGYGLTLTASMDEATVQAVKDFQTRSGLYSYGVLDYTTMETLERACRNFVYNESTEDKQLEKALELLK